MNRSLWLLAALFAAMAVAVIYQSEFGGGVDRPWAECRESMIQQMFSDRCTPRAGVLRLPAETDANQ